MNTKRSQPKSVHQSALKRELVYTRKLFEDAVKELVYAKRVFAESADAMTRVADIASQVAERCRRHAVATFEPGMSGGDPC